MIKLLILTPYLPYPINSGGNQLFFQLVERLRQYIDISIIFSVKKTDSNNVEKLQSLWPNVKFYLYYRDDLSNKKDYTYSTKFLYKLKKIIDRRFYKRYIKSNSRDLVRIHSILRSEILTPDERYIDFIENVVRSNPFDMVQVDFFELINLVNILPDNLKRVFIHHEIRFVRAEQELVLMQKQSPLDIYFLKNIKSAELQYLNCYDGIVTLTDVDNDKLKRELKDNIFVATSPAIVDIKTLDLSSSFCFNNKLVFLGGSDHFPNLDAVDWFLNNCWKGLRSAKPKLEFHIIGQWKSKLKKKYTKEFDQVFFRGFVDDLSVALTDTIMIVPLRIGSGVRIKILDAISKGVPFISTSIGAEGIILDDREDCIIADGKELFINAILTLANDNDLCNNFRIRARSKLDMKKTPDQLALTRLNIYENLLGMPLTQNK